jgi:hypothetical protein
MWPEQANVELGNEPLKVQDIGALRAERSQPDWMLGDLERQPQARALEQS